MNLGSNVRSSADIFGQHAQVLGWDDSVRTGFGVVQSRHGRRRRLEPTSPSGARWRALASLGFGPAGRLRSVRAWTTPTNRGSIFTSDRSVCAANAFVAVHHRHHGPTRGHKFSISVVDAQGQIRGVVIAGRPNGRRLDDGAHLEVLRCARMARRTPAPCCTERCVVPRRQWGIGPSTSSPTPSKARMVPPSGLPAGSSTAAPKAGVGTTLPIACRFPPNGEEAPLARRLIYEDSHRPSTTSLTPPPRLDGIPRCVRESQCESGSPSHRGSGCRPRVLVNQPGFAIGESDRAERVTDRPRVSVQSNTGSSRFSNGKTRRAARPLAHRPQATRGGCPDSPRPGDRARSRRRSQTSCSAWRGPSPRIAPGLGTRTRAIRKSTTPIFRNSSLASTDSRELPPHRESHRPPRARQTAR